MKRQLIILNAGLVLLVVGASFQFRNSWTGFGSSHDAGRVQYTGDAVTAPVLPGNRDEPEVQRWTDISDENLFSFDRNDISVEAAEVAVVAGPLPILFGTVSFGTAPMAMLAIGAIGNRDYRPMHVGEVIDGWTLVEIQSKSVVVESGGMRETVIMNDPTAQMARDQSRTIARTGATAQVSTVQAPRSSEAQSSPVVNGDASRPATPNPATISPQNVPPGFMIQQTPFGNVLVRKPQV